MKLAAIVLLAVLLAGSASAEKWGYLVNESNTSQIYGVVPDAQKVIDVATPLGNDMWVVNDTTYWKSWNNMQWHMKPYPALPFQSPEVEISHITISTAGNHYLIGVARWW